MKHIALKDFALFAATAVLAVALLLTVGSIQNQVDCPPNLLLADCNVLSEKGAPVAYWQQSRTDGSSHYLLGGFIIDLGIWLIIAGVLVSGGLLLLPDIKTDNKKK